jgi:ribonuclease P protein component
VAFAIGRAVGPAVARNRLRRRLRAILTTRQPPLPAGLYLFGARPAAVARSFAELEADVSTMLDRMARA